MQDDTTLSRRGVFMKLGILLNACVGAALALPIGRFLLSSITRGRANGYLAWVSLGPVSQFPEGETKLATFRNPLVMPTDGKTVDTACWVRRVVRDVGPSGLSRNGCRRGPPRSSSGRTGTASPHSAEDSREAEHLPHPAEGRGRRIWFAADG